MKDKPPTTESLQTARRFADALQKAQNQAEMNNLRFHGDIDKSKEMFAQQYPAALPSLTIQTNPSHVFMEKQSFKIQFGDKEAQGFLTVKDGKLHFDGDLDESAKLFFEQVCKHAINYEKGFHEGYFEGHETGYQAGLRKAAEAL